VKEFTGQFQASKLERPGCGVVLDNLFLEITCLRAQSVWHMAKKVGIDLGRVSVEEDVDTMVCRSYPVSRDGAPNSELLFTCKRCEN
jgi:hypothetical protein